MTCHQRFEGVHSCNKHYRVSCDEDDKKEEDTLLGLQEGPVLREKVGKQEGADTEQGITRIRKLW